MVPSRLHPQFYFRLTGWGGALAILGFPVSVSLSQLGLFLALAGWILQERAARRAADPLASAWRLPFCRSPVLLAALAMYGLELISLLLNALLKDGGGAWAMIARGLQREFKDLWLMAGAFWIFAYTADERGERRVFRWLEISAWILVLSGLVSVFSRFRLSKFPYHMLYGWVGSEAARYQHHLGTFFADSAARIHIYMPIGFMNTHLTYAALLGFVFPFLLLRVLHPFLTTTVTGWAGLRAALATLCAGRGIPLAGLVGATLVLLLNNGRSALFGLSISLIFALYYFIRTHWGWRVWRVLPFVAGAAVFFAVLVNFSPRFHDRFERIMTALAGQEKHTDYHRTFLWQGTLEIVRAHPVIGVGPGAWNEQIDATLLRLSQERPRLWYAYQIIQRGHAHNDFMHLVAIAGPAAGIAFLLFIGLFLYRALGPSATLAYEYWKWGPVLVFFGGLYQCYFQDDEVLLPFWLLVGLALRGLHNARESSSV